MSLVRSSSHLAPLCAAVLLVGCAAGRGRSGPVAIELDVPQRALPATGLCRIWIPGQPVSRQPMTRGCDGIVGAAPLGSWVLYRPDDGSREVIVRYMSRGTPGWVTGIDAFSVDTMRLTRIVMAFRGEPPR